jgi:hypothetical protein
VQIAFSFVDEHVVAIEEDTELREHIGNVEIMPVPSQGHYGFHSFPVVD